MFKNIKLPGSIFLLLLLAPLCATHGQTDQYVGEIRLVPFNFAPTGWANCSGQIMSISQNTALFSLLGTTYGGDGKSTFALPNLNASVAVDAGQGPGLSNYVLGQSGGASTVTLTANQIPVHAHAFRADTHNGTTDTPIGNYPAANAAGAPQYATATNGQMNSGMVGTAGGGQPHNNMMPYLGLKFIIALQGVFPSRPAITPGKSAPTVPAENKH